MLVSGNFAEPTTQTKTEIIMTHKYWGKVEEDWAGFSSDITFSNPFLDKQNDEILLGEEYDEDGDEIEEFPTENLLTEFAETSRYSIENLEINIKSIQDQAYE